MNKTEKLIATIKAVKVPPAYDAHAWKLDAIREDAKLDIFRMLSHAFEYGFLKGQRAAKAELPSDLVRLLNRADERQLNLITQFVKGLI